MAAAFERPAAVVHEQADAILALDREPLRWSGPGTRGLAWEEQLASLSRSAESVEEASAGACGLALTPAGPVVHPSSSGIGPLYVRVERDAVYFATTVAALVEGSASPLSVDWEAWSSILTLGYPLGDRTPFAEIRRLLPDRTVRWTGDRAAIEARRWPWAEIDPVLSVEEGAGAVVETLRAAVARLGAHAAVCQLSGGQDSRICLALLAEGDRDVLALSADEDRGEDAEQRIAAEVAATLGVRHETVAGTSERYWQDLEILARRVDYAFVRSPWRLPMFPAMRASGGVVVDGFGFDTIAGPGNRFFTPEATATSGGDEVMRGLWAPLSRRRARPTATGLRAELGEAMWASAERQLLAASEPLRGHPARAVLTFWLARQVRGIALGPAAVLGAEFPVSMPLVAEEAARATLGISFAAKRGHRLYDAVLAALDPRLTAIPTTSREDPVEAEATPRRSQSPAVADAFRSCLDGSPLRPVLDPRKVAALLHHARGDAARAPAALLGPAYFSLWHRRYRDRLREADPRDALA
jgi:hypothetical protein